MANTRMMPSYYCKKALGVYSSASLTRATRARAWRSYSTTAASYMIKKEKNKADKLAASTGKTVLPSITARAEAKEEAD
jgi:hypothetical protein